MQEDVQVDEDLVKSFHLMWDHFPEVVQLTHKSFLVLAVNPAADRVGRKVGMICAKHGPPELHKGCKARQTVQQQKATWKATPPTQPGKIGSVTFWLPIEGYPDYYLHFAVGNTMDFTEPQE